MILARHPGEYVSMVRGEKPASKKKREEDKNLGWRNPDEGVGP